MSRQVNKLEYLGDHLLYHHVITSTVKQQYRKGHSLKSQGKLSSFFPPVSIPVIFVHASGSPIFNGQGNKSPHLTSAGKGHEVGLQSHSWRGWTLKSQLIRGHGRKQPGPLDLGPHGHINEDHSHTCNFPYFKKAIRDPFKVAVVCK